MPRFQFEWKSRVPNADGYILYNTEVTAPRDVLDAVLNLLPKTEHTFTDVEKEQLLRQEAYKAERKKMLHDTVTVETFPSSEKTLEFEEFQEEKSAEYLSEAGEEADVDLDMEDFFSGVDASIDGDIGGEVYRSPNEDVITIYNSYRKVGVNEWESFDKVETLKIKRRNLIVDQFLSEND